MSGLSAESLPGATTQTHPLPWRTKRFQQTLASRKSQLRGNAPCDRKFQPTHPVSVTGHSAEALPSCLPTGPVAEHNETLLVCPLDEGHTSVLLPVSHGLFKNGPLAA